MVKGSKSEKSPGKKGRLAMTAIAVDVKAQKYAVVNVTSVQNLPSIGLQCVKGNHSRRHGDGFVTCPSIYRQGQETKSVKESKDGTGHVEFFKVL